MLVMAPWADQEMRAALDDDRAQQPRPFVLIAYRAALLRPPPGTGPPMFMGPAIGFSIIRCHGSSFQSCCNAAPGTTRVAGGAGRGCEEFTAQCVRLSPGSLWLVFSGWTVPACESARSSGPRESFRGQQLPLAPELDPVVDANAGLYKSELQDCILSMVLNHHGSRPRWSCTGELPAAPRRRLRLLLSLSRCMALSLLERRRAAPPAHISCTPTGAMPNGCAQCACRVGKSSGKTAGLNKAQAYKLHLWSRF